MSTPRCSTRSTTIFKLTLEGVNLTDEVQDQFNDCAPTGCSFYHHTGASSWLGVRYTY